MLAKQNQWDKDIMENIAGKFFLDIIYDKLRYTKEFFYFSSKINNLLKLDFYFSEEREKMRKIGVRILISHKKLKTSVSFKNVKEMNQRCNIVYCIKNRHAYLWYEKEIFDK